MKRYFIPIICGILILGIVFVKGIKYNKQKEEKHSQLEVVQSLQEECSSNLRDLKTRFALASNQKDREVLVEIESEIDSLMNKCSDFDFITSDLKMMKTKCKMLINNIAENEKRKQEKQEREKRCAQQFSELYNRYGTASEINEFKSIIEEASQIMKNCYEFEEIIKKLQDLIIECRKGIREKERSYCKAQLEELENKYDKAIKILGLFKNKEKLREIESKVDYLESECNKYTDIWLKMKNLQKNCYKKLK